MREVPVVPGKKFTPQDVLAIARRRKWVILIPAVLIAGAVAIWAHGLPDSFRSETLILVVPQRVPESYVRSTVTARIEDRLQSITQQILSRTRLERIIQDFNLYAEKRKTGIMEDIVEQMRRDIEVQIVKGDAFRVSYTADEARTAMRVTERLASLFIEENLRDREVLAEGTNQFLEAQLEDARRRLVETEKKLEEYRRLHAGELPANIDSNMTGMHNAEMQLQALLDSLNRDRDHRLVLERLIADASAPETASPAPVPMGATEDPMAVPGTAADRLQAARVALQQMELRLRPAHPDVLRMKRVVSDLAAKVEKENAERPVSDSPSRRTNPVEVAKKNRLDEVTVERGNLDRLIAAKTADEKRLRAVMADYQRRIEVGPTRESDLSELNRDYATLQQIYQTLLAKKEDSKVAANLERRQIGEQFKILDPARLPEKPSSPDRRRLNLMGIVAALGLGFTLAAFFEYQDETLRSEEDVRSALNILVLATIPVVKTAKAGWSLRWKLAAATATTTVLLGIGGAAWKFLR
jgi:polysaccharide chain length determinant protein (PEP-CTERM system associated)